MADLQIQKADHEGGELAIKRLYVPYVFTATCPACNSSVTLAGNRALFSYPTLGAKESLYFTCNNGHEWVEYVRITLVVERCE